MGAVVIQALYPKKPKYRVSEKPKPATSKTSQAATAKKDKDLTNLFIRFPLCEAQPIHQHRTTL